jgi:hypothetical protein
MFVFMLSEHEFHTDLLSYQDSLIWIAGLAYIFNSGFSFLWWWWISIDEKNGEENTELHDCQPIFWGRK